MKTQIIQLDPHDDYISARDKIGWSKAARVLLIFPERNVTLTRELDLVLLKRHCDSLGAQIALITKDGEIRFRAHNLGIPIFSSVSSAQRRHWRTRNQRHANQATNNQTLGPSNRKKIDTLKSLVHPTTPPWTNRLEVRLIFFAIGVIAVLAIASVLLPQADITLEPIIKQQEITIRIAASSKNQIVNISGAIPAQPISVTVEGRDQITSTGTIALPDQLASGAVVFTNLTDQPVTIPVGTVVRTTSGVTLRFATTRESKLEAEVGNNVSVPIEALKPGISGNLPAGSLTAIEGSLGINLSVENTSPTTGGSERISPAPNSTDETRLYNRLYSTLIQSAVDEIVNQLDEGDVLLSSEPEKVEVINKEFEPPEPQPADQLKLTLQLECQFLIAKANDIRQLSNLALNANLPENYLPVDGSLLYSNLTDPIDLGDAEYEWKLDVKRQIQAVINPTDTINLVIGLSPAEASERLKHTLPLEDDPKIILTPSWWFRLPFLPFRVKIISPY